MEMEMQRGISAPAIKYPLLDEPRAWLEGRQLVPAAIDVMAQPVDVRIAFARESIWVPYKGANKIIACIEDELDAPRAQRMPWVVIWGPPNHGKSAIVSYLKAVHPRVDRGKNQTALHHVVCMEVDSPGEHSFFDAGCIAIKSGFHLRTAEEKKIHFKAQLLEHKSKMLVIDEAHEVLNGTVRQQKLFWGFAKNVSNVRQMTLVIVGTRKVLTAIERVDDDGQVETRFLHRFELELWKDPKSWGKWLTGYEANLPLRKVSALWADDIVEYIQTFSDGVLGEAVTLLQTAAVAALKSGRECITLDLLKSLTLKPKRLRVARR